MWRYPFGSGGKRVPTVSTRPAWTSAATMSRMKSPRSGAVTVGVLTPPEGTRRVLVTLPERVGLASAVDGGAECFDHSRVYPDGVIVGRECAARDLGLERRKSHLCFFEDVGVPLGVSRQRALVRLAHPGVAGLVYPKEVGAEQE